MTKVTRRNFLAGSGKSLVLGAASGALGLSALEFSRVQGANERVNLALVGCGGRGNYLARGFMENGAVFTHICDPHADRVDNMAQVMIEQQGVKPEKVKDMRSAFESKDVDAVVVATPNHWHALPAIQACQAGKDVYLEKPQSNNIWEGRQIIRAARKYDRIVQIGTQNRSAPYIQAARDYIADGKLGDIHLVKVYNLKSNAAFHGRGEPFLLGKPETPPPQLDWQDWIGGAKFLEYRENLFAYGGWIAFWDYSAGDMDDAIHQIDIAALLMGEPVPKSVSSQGGRLHYKNDDAEVPDAMVSTYDCGNFIMTLDLSGYPLYMQKTTGTIRRSDEFPYWTQNATRVELYGSKELMIIGRMGGGWITMTSGGKVVNKMYGRVPDVAHQQNFIACVKSRKQPNGDVEIVNNSANLVHMANIAHRVGNLKLQYDAENEQFVDNTAANKLLRYDYRQPFTIPSTV